MAYAAERKLLSNAMREKARRGAKVVVRELKKAGLDANHKGLKPGTSEYIELRKDIAQFVVDACYDEASARMGDSQFTDAGHDRWWALREEMEAHVYEMTGGWAEVDPEDARE